MTTSKRFAGKCHCRSLSADQCCLLIDGVYYSSFREYLDCSEDVTRRTCGAETGSFIRGFLKKMSSTLEKDYCEEYYKHGVNQCPNIFSSASSIVGTSTAVKALFLSFVMVMFNLR